MKKLLLIIGILLCTTGCFWEKPDTLILNDSEVVYVVVDGKLNYYDDKGELSKVATLSEVQGWYILSPGYLSKLIKAKQDEKLPK